jgi:hypothetical protein
MMAVLGFLGVSAAAGGFIWYKLLKPFSRSLQLADELDPVRSIPAAQTKPPVGGGEPRFAGSSASMSDSLTRLLHAVTPVPGPESGAIDGDKTRQGDADPAIRVQR